MNDIRKGNEHHAIDNGIKERLSSLKNENIIFFVL